MKAGGGEGWMPGASEVNGGDPRALPCVGKTRKSPHGKGARLATPLRQMAEARQR